MFTLQISILRWGVAHTAVVITMLLGATVSRAANIEGAVENVGGGIAVVASHSAAGLSNTGFPTHLFIQGANNLIRVEYLKYGTYSSTASASTDYQNEAVLGYANFEYLLRARRGSILGRTKLYGSVGLGLFRSTVTNFSSTAVNPGLINFSNVQHNKSDYNIGFTVAGGMRYFLDPKFFIGGEIKYLNAYIQYDKGTVSKRDIGGIFFNVLLGYRLSSSADVSQKVDT